MSLIESLHKWETKTPEKTAFSFLDDKGDVVVSLNYRQLMQRSNLIAESLLTVHKLNVGDRVLLVYPPSVDFIVAFIGCLIAGVVAVPTFPPDPSRMLKDTIIFNSIMASSGAVCALTSNLYRNAIKIAELKHLMIEGKSIVPPISWIVTDSIIFGGRDDTSVLMEFKCPSPEDVAFLQYTSGSTSEPKGVIVTHGSLKHNLQLIISGLQASDDTIVVSWLPQYHDMGLIGSYLGAVFCGGCGFYMSPYSFIRNPSLWVQCMSKYKGTHIQAPNFAYTLTARKFLAKLALNRNNTSGTLDIDLSSVRHMINAAEPVEATSIEAFYAVFEQFGLKRGVIFPTYGLAEHTVYVCSNGSQRLVVDRLLMERDRCIHVYSDAELQRKPISSKPVVGDVTVPKKDVVVLMGCGLPSDSDQLDLRIVDTESLLSLAEDRVGEIWLHSPSAAAGYWGMEEKSVADFEAVLSTCNSNDSSRKYLRTGDLGFLHNGELFVCGRLKDLIIIRGRNHYPQDIERTCEAVKSSDNPLELRRGCSAAFSVSVSGQELLVYVAELNDGCGWESYTIAQGDSFLDKIRVEVQISHGVSPSAICLLAPRSIQKTSSGKIARQWVRRAYLEGTLKSQLSWSDLDSCSSSSDRSDGSVFTVIPSCSQKAMEELGEEGDRMDPTGQPLQVVLHKLTQAVAQCLHRDASHISPIAPLASLGMDSMQSIALQSILDASFTIALPDELMFEIDATLSTLAECLVNGGAFKYRPIMLQGSDLYEAARKIELSKPYNKTFLGVWFGIDSTVNKGGNMMSAMLSPQWVREHQVKAHVDSLSFPDGCALEEVALRPNDDAFAIFYSFLFFGVFMWLPVCIALVFVLFPLKIAVSIFTTFLIVVYSGPFDCYPACFRTGWAVGLVNRYYSYRMIIEAPRECYTSVPSVYSFGPHGVFSIAPVIQTLINEFALGENMHFLAASAALCVPVYNVYLRMMGFRSVDRKPFKDTLLSGRSVGIIPGGIAEMFSTNADTEIMMVQERKGFIAIALETGTQVVPCYCFGNTQTFSCGSNRYLEYLSRVFRMSLIVFWGRFGLPVPYRAAQLTVVGRPLLLPKVAHPTAELINDYHEQYLRETRRIYDKYKNTYNWQERKLVFKR